MSRKLLVRNLSATPLPPEMRCNIVDDERVGLIWFVVAMRCWEKEEVEQEWQACGDDHLQGSLETVVAQR